MPLSLLKATMQITLMRHGKPRLAASRWLAPCDMDGWIEQYDEAGIHVDAIPAATGVANVVLTSTLPRAIASARALGHTTPRVDAVFREAALSFPQWRFPRLPPSAWAAIFRVAWLCGYTRGADTLAVVRLRARAASAQLIACAADGPVLLVGHGIMNRLIARELRAAGWISRSRQRSGYWATTRFEPA
jgi:broad specificity phosphatase PhoE